MKRSLTKVESRRCLRKAAKLISLFIDYCKENETEFKLDPLPEVANKFYGDVPDAFITKINIVYDIESTISSESVLDSSILYGSPDKAFNLAENIVANTTNSLF